MNSFVGKKKEGIIYFDKSKLPSKWIVMRRMGVKVNSFAGNMISRLYDYYFAGAVNFKKEYRKYYSKEYVSIIEYMEQHYNIPKEDAKILAAGTYSMKRCMRDSVERNIDTLNYDCAFKEAFSIAVGGIVDED